MKTFPTLFAAEKNKKTGPAPVWILKCPFATGTVYLSDRTFTVATWNGGITTKPWVSAWGAIDEDLSGDLAAPKVSDLSLELLIDPNASPNIDAILWNASNNLETTDCELYLWFIGLTPSTDPPQKMWVGNIIDYEKTDELHYRVQLIDQSVRLDKYVGEKLDLTAYPSCDPDDVGRVAPTVYGSVTKVPARAVDAGAMTTLPADITATQTSFALSDGSRLSSGKVIQIDDEQISITTISGNNITSCTRGYNTTGPLIHGKGAVVWEKKTKFVYLFANHAVKSIGQIFGRVGDAELDITSLCTKYTGKTGNELAGYSGKAVISVPGYPTLDRSLYDQIALTDAGHSHSVAPSGSPQYAYPQYSSCSDGWDNCADEILVFPDGFTYSGHTLTPHDAPKFYFSSIWTDANHTIAFDKTNKRPTWITLEIGAWCKTIDKETPLYINGRPSTDVNGKLLTGEEFAVAWGNTIRVRVPVSKWSEVEAVTITSAPMVWWWLGDILMNINNVEWEAIGTSSSPAGITKAGSITFAGNSVANTLVGDEVLISGQGYQDDPSGTFTGTANALITRPDHVIKHLLYQQSAWAVANFSTNAGGSFTSKGYAFNGVLDESRQLRELLSALAFQCRSYFRFAAGKAQLLYRTDSIPSVKTITKFMIRMNDDGTSSTSGPRPSPLMDVINKVALHYDRNWDQSGPEAYKKISKGSDSASIAKYGEKEKPELFYFDFVTTQAMADDLRAFYLARYKNRKKLFSLDVFLDNSELDFADGITLTPQANVICEVQKANTMPGSAKEMRNDRVTLTVMEY